MKRRKVRDLKKEKLAGIFEIERIMNESVAQGTLASLLENKLDF